MLRFFKFRLVGPEKTKRIIGCLHMTFVNVDFNVDWNYDLKGAQRLS